MESKQSHHIHGIPKNNYFIYRMSISPRNYTLWMMPTACRINKNLKEAGKETIHTDQTQRILRWCVFKTKITLRTTTVYCLKWLFMYNISLPISHTFFGIKKWFHALKTFTFLFIPFADDYLSTHHLCLLFIYSFSPTKSSLMKLLFGLQQTLRDILDALTQHISNNILSLPKQLFSVNV